MMKLDYYQGQGSDAGVSVVGHDPQLIFIAEQNVAKDRAVELKYIITSILNPKTRWSLILEPATQQNTTVPLLTVYFRIACLCFAGVIMKPINYSK